MEEKTLRCEEKVMLGKEQWKALMVGNECRPDSLGSEDPVNDLEQ